MPYLVNFGFFTIYCQFFLEGSKLWTLLLVPPILTAIVQLAFEGKQIYEERLLYFRGSGAIWNFLDIATSVLVIILFFMRLAGAVTNFAFFGVAGFAVFFMWLKLFYFLRLFKNTAAFIRMIVEMIKDIRVFLLVFFIAIFAFASAYSIFDRFDEGKEVVEKSIL